MKVFLERILLNRCIEVRLRPYLIMPSRMELPNMDFEVDRKDSSNAMVLRHGDISLS